MIKRIWFWITMILAMAALTSVSYAVTFGLKLGDGNTMLSTQTIGKQETLFLPGSWAGKDLIVCTDNEGGLWINEQNYQNGDTIPAPTECQFVYRKEGRKSKNTVTVYVGSEIPSVFIDMMDADYKTIYNDRNAKVVAGAVCYNADGQIEYNQSLEYIKTRGNTSFNYPKKPYQIKFMQKIPLFGLDKAKKYVLLADYLDISLLRNRITLEMAKAIGLPYAIDCMHVDLYINGSYRGLYLLTEKIEISSSSVAITDLQKETEKVNELPLNSYAQKHRTKNLENLLGMRWHEIPTDPQDITGGYLLETDKEFRWKKADDDGFITDNSMAVYIKEPQEASEAQVLYIGNLVSAFHRALLARDGVDTLTGKHYSQIIDVDSFALKFLIEETCKNYDALRGSQYFYKAAGEDSLIYACCAWDYDLSWGDIRTDVFNAHSRPPYFYIANYTNPHFWWNNLIFRSEFEERVIELYNERLHGVLAVLAGEKAPEEGTTLRSVNDYSKEIAASANMNFHRWSRSKDSLADAGTNFNQGVKYLQNFVTKRMAFLDKEWLHSDD